VTPLRGIAFVVGLALLSATAHATITTTGGYGTAHSFITMTVAAGVGVSAIVAGSIWTTRRGLALWLVLAIIAGEAFGLLSTAERLVASREAAQAPLRALAERYAKAAQRVSDAAAALASAPTTSLRLERALSRKDAADKAASEKAAERGCRENCRQLLQGQVDDAGQEVAAARAELATNEATQTREFSVATAELAAIKTPVSATPLADRVGIAAWLIDLIAAALASIAANGMACGLIAFAGHSKHGATDEPHRTPATIDIAATEPQLISLEPIQCVRRFAADRIFPGAPGDKVAVDRIRADLNRWCAERQIEPPSGPALGRAMGELFDRLGIDLEKKDGRLVALGIRLTEPTALIAAE
jgi:hypothetical protein